MNIEELIYVYGERLNYERKNNFYIKKICK